MNFLRNMRLEFSATCPVCKFQDATYKMNLIFKY